MPSAIVTGVTGQCGSYLSELLLSKNYKVIGVTRRTSTDNTHRISSLLHTENFTLVEGEVSDTGSVYSLVNNYKPDIIFNAAAQSHVATSFEQPDYTFQVDALGPLYFLEAIRRFSPETRFVQFSTSEMFGKEHDELIDLFDGRTSEKYQDEQTRFMPQSPYAVAKLAAHHLVRLYREAYGLHASCAIIFNNESPRRGEKFVTRKITKWIADFYHWKQSHEDGFSFGLRADYDYIVGNYGSRFPKLRLGNLDACRDWGYSGDYMKAVYLMSVQPNPDDYVVATGVTCSVRNFLKVAFKEIGIDDFEPYIIIDPKFYRPAEVDYLRGISCKAREQLGWEPQIKFHDLVKIMVWSDINGQEKALYEETMLLSSEEEKQGT